MPTRPSFMLMRMHYPDPFNVSSEELWQWIGHPENALDRAWENTCAIRMSLCLAGCGVWLPGAFLPVKAGKFRGQRIEIKQEMLANRLVKIWGEPEKFGAALLKESMAGRRGVIRFVGLWGPFDPQGHIDLISADRHNQLACEAGHVYWDAVECWFWELP